MNEQENWYYIRWGAVLVYLSAVFLLIALLFIFPSLELVLGIAVMLVSVVGIVPLIIVINIPFLRMMMGSSGPEPNAKVGTGAPPSGRRSFYSDSVRMHPLIWIIVPLNLYIMVIVLLSSELLVILISLPVVLILSLSLLFFWKLEVQADKDHISFHFGPFGKTVDCSDIRSIRAVEVHALRDFMGWGWRSGSDGSIGYISNAKEGVNIETKSGRRYTITCHRPEELLKVVSGRIGR